MPANRAIWFSLLQPHGCLDTLAQPLQGALDFPIASLDEAVIATATT